MPIRQGGDIQTGRGNTRKRYLRKVYRLAAARWRLGRGNEGLDELGQRKGGGVRQLIPPHPGRATDYLRLATLSSSHARPCLWSKAVNSKRAKGHI